MLSCKRCGNSTKRVIQQKDGDLWCPTCHEGMKFEGLLVAPGVVRDGIPGGIICENYGPKPIRFDSHTERRAYMAAHGLREKETFCPAPGTDKDPQGVPNPADKDPYTLAAGAAMLARNGAREPVFDPESVMTMTSGTISDEEARRVTRQSSS